MQQGILGAAEAVIALEDGWLVYRDPGVHRRQVVRVEYNAGSAVPLLRFHDAQQILYEKVLQWPGSTDTEKSTKEQSLAKVNREIEAPKLRNLLKAGFVIFLYSLLLTSVVSFLAVLIIPDGKRVQTRMLREHGIEIGGGLGPSAPPIWRIGLMGHNARVQVAERVLEALDAVLADEPALAPAAV